jgi:hypothetical protein
MSKKLLISAGTVMFLFLAAVIIVPNFIPARHSNNPGCIGYLKWIEGATAQWALENQKKDTDVPELAGVIRFLPQKEMPKCPKGGVYRLGATVADRPVCTLAVTHGHSLSPGK